VTLLTSCALLSSVLFTVAGVSCFVGTDMRREFTRFGLDRLRVLTGVLELLGAGGLVVGLWWPPVLRLAAGGLALLMLAAMAIRARQRDGAWLMFPAALLVGLNGVILAASLRR